MTQILFKVISPEKEFFSKNVNMVIVPATEGDIGIKKGHSAFISTIRPGTIVIKNSSEEHRIFVENGFLEITHEKAILLTERANFVSQLSKEDIEKNISYAESEDKKKVAEAQLQALENPCYTS